MHFNQLNYYAYNRQAPTDRYHWDFFFFETFFFSQNFQIFWKIVIFLKIFSRIVRIRLDWRALIESRIPNIEKKEGFYFLFCWKKLFFPKFQTSWKKWFFEIFWVFDSKKMVYKILKDFCIVFFFLFFLFFFCVDILDFCWIVLVFIDFLRFFFLF